MTDSGRAEEKHSLDKKRAEEEAARQQTAKGLIHYKSHYTDEWIKPNEVSLYRELDAVREKYAAKMELEKKWGEIGKKVVELESKGIELESKGIELENKDAELEKKTIELGNKGADLENKSMELEKKVIELRKKVEEAHKEEIEILKRLDEDRKREHAEHEKRIGDSLKEMKDLELQMRMTAHEISAESTTIRSLRWGEETKKLLEKKK